MAGGVRAHGRLDSINDELAPQIQAIAGRIADGWADTIDVGPGWLDLLARLDRQLAEISSGYVIEQCKTKFGTLRYYAHPEDADHPDAARVLGHHPGCRGRKRDRLRGLRPARPAGNDPRVGLDPLPRARTAADEPFRDVGWLIHHE